MPIPGLGLARWSSHSRKSSKSYSPRPSGSIDSVHDGFGLPSPDDPDPFGVRALELAGLAIKEAGSKSRPDNDAFDYRPSPTSPVFRLSTQSIDTVALRDVRRDSKRSTMSVDHGTQTAGLPSPTFREISRIIDSPPLDSPAPIDEGHRPVSTTESSHGVQADVPETIDELENEEEDEFFEDEEPEVVIEEAKPSLQVVNCAVVSLPTTKAKIVSIQRRGPPALPIKNPRRQHRIEALSQTSDGHASDIELRDDASSTYSSSPSKSAFDRSEYETNPWSEQTSLQDSDSVRHKDDNCSDKDVLHFSDRETSRSGTPSHIDTLHDMEQLPEPDQTTPVATLKKSDLAAVGLGIPLEGSTTDAADVSNIPHIEADAVESKVRDLVAHVGDVAASQEPDDFEDAVSLSSYYGEGEEKAEHAAHDSFHSVPQTPLDPPKEHLNFF